MPDSLFDTFIRKIRKYLQSSVYSDLAKGLQSFFNHFAVVHFIVFFSNYQHRGSDFVLKISTIYMQLVISYGKSSRSLDTGTLPACRWIIAGFPVPARW